MGLSNYQEPLNEAWHSGYKEYQHRVWIRVCLQGHQFSVVYQTPPPKSLPAQSSAKHSGKTPVQSDFLPQAAHSHLQNQESEISPSPPLSRVPLSAGQLLGRTLVIPQRAIGGWRNGEAVPQMCQLPGSERKLALPTLCPSHV